jgi:methyl-accepting chemotaxis protein PixJ
MAQARYPKNRRSSINRRVKASSKKLDRPANRPSDLYSLSTRPKPKVSLNLRQHWENLGFRSKLTLFLIVGIALALLVATQITVGLTQQQAIANLDHSLRIDLNLLEEEISLAQTDMENSATTLAKLVEVTGIDVSNANQASTQRNQIKAILSEAVAINPRASLYFIINNQGQPIAQQIQVKAKALAQYPPLPTQSVPEITQYQPVSLAEEFDFRKIPIIADALNLRTSLKGMELLDRQAIEKLGLGQQANIGIRAQKVEGLPESQQPFPEGTFNIGDGKVGLTAMAAVPIHINNEMVGVAVLGTLVNNNFELVDRLKQKTGAQAVTIFAQDWRVSTNVPYSDLKTRAVGTRASREVADTVLNQKKVFLGEANIIGTRYRTAYSPLYDHQRVINSKLAKPIGIAFVGQSRRSIQKSLLSFTLTSYGVGGVVLILAGLISAQIANALSTALHRLADFAQKVGAGDRRIRLDTTARRDEIGILTQRMNQMVNDLESNEEQERIRQETERAHLKFLSEITASDVRNLQDLDNVLEAALQFIRETLGVDRIVIYRFNPDWSGTIAAESVASPWVSTLNWETQDPCIPMELIKAYEKGRVASTSNVFEAGFHPRHLKLMEDLEIKANLIMPVLVEEVLFGLLIIHQCSAPRLWQEYEVTFLKQASTQFGLAIGRVTFLEQLKDMAEQQQYHKEMLQSHALQLLQDVEAVSQGDLTVEVSVTEDEIGTIADFYNSTIESLRKLVLKVKTTAQEVIETTSNNEVSVQNLVIEVDKQAIEVTATLGQIEKIIDSIRDVTAIAEQTKLEMQQANLVVQEGNAAMEL